MKHFSSMIAIALTTSFFLTNIASAQTDSTEIVPKQKMKRPVSLKQSGFAASIYYNSMSQLTADKDVEFGNNYSGMRWKNLSFEIEQAPGIVIAYQQRPLEGLGFSLGGYFEKERKITAAKTDIEVVGFNIPYKGTNTDMTYQEWGLDGNLIYSINQIYFPFGAHLSFSTINGGNSTVKNQTGIGIQGGVGFQPVGWFAAELGVRTTSVAVKFDQAKENTVLTGSGITLMSKFLF